MSPGGEAQAQAEDPQLTSLVGRELTMSKNGQLPKYPRRAAALAPGLECSERLLTPPLPRGGVSSRWGHLISSTLTWPWPWDWLWPGDGRRPMVTAHGGATSERAAPGANTGGSAPDPPGGQAQLGQTSRTRVLLCRFPPPPSPWVSYLDIPASPGTRA